MNKLECVSRIRLFEGFPQRLLKKISALCVERRYAAGEVLCREGTTGLGLFFVVEGWVEVYGTSRAGREKSLALLGPGEMFGEMMILDNSPRSASVRSLQPATCYVMPQWDFKRLLKDYPEIAVKMLPTLVKRIRELDKAMVG
ncbi:MAG: cyclic nucleotide-binding domain-containing protein [Nitrospinota bacterium]